MTNTLQNLEELKQDFFRIIQKANGLDLERQRILLDLKDQISECRKLKVGYQKISKIFKNRGIEMSSSDVLYFCKEHLGEKEVKKSKVSKN